MKKIVLREAVIVCIGNNIEIQPADKLHIEYLSKIKYTVDIIIQDTFKRRSVKISTRFHAHCSWLWKKLISDGVTVTRDYIYLKSLLTACSIDDNDCFGDPYPYVIIDDVLYPARTSNCTNKQMMTACQGLYEFAFENYFISQSEFPERIEEHYEA